MDNTKLAIWASAIAGVALVIIVLMQRSGETVTSSPVFEVNGISPEVAAIRSSERIEQIHAKRDTALGYLSYLLGIKQTDAGVTLGTIESNNAVNIATVEANAAGQIAAMTTASQERVALQGYMTATQLAQLEASTARYVAEQQKKAQKASATASTVGGITGVIAGILSFL